MTSVDLNSSLLSMLVCPACSEFMRAPIRQCRNGHNICSECIKVEPNCPTCEKNFIRARNYALEELAEKAQFPCPYSGNGCKFMGLHVDLQEHWRSCQRRSLRCAVRPCKWYGSLSQVIHHMRKSHSSKILARGTIVLIPKSWTSLSENMWDVYILQDLNKLFWVHIKLEGNNGKLMSAVQNTDSGCYMYEIKLKVGNDLLMFRSETVSETENMNNVFTAEHCFSVSTKLAKHFIVHSDFELHINVTNMSK